MSRPLAPIPIQVRGQALFIDHEWFAKSADRSVAQVHIIVSALLRSQALYRISRPVFSVQTNNSHGLTVAQILLVLTAETGRVLPD
jgi:hypothetical protein